MTQLVLYGGKGGVGKTTCAAATGLKLAREGHDTLVVSTDPAHSLSDSLEADVAGEPRAVREHLWGVEIDPEARLDRYRGMAESLADDLRDVGLRVDDEDVEEVFASGAAPGSDEVAAMDVLVDFLDADRWEYVVLDTAPTGHTLRLLELPDVVGTTVEKTLEIRGQVRRLADSARTMVFGPFGARRREADGDEFLDLKARMERVRDLLRDPERTEFRVVLIPERMAITETERMVERLRAFEIPVRTLVVNKVLAEIDESCDRCRTRKAAHEERLAEIRETFPDLEVRTLPEREREVYGLAALEEMADHIEVRDGTRGAGRDDEGLPDGQAFSGRPE